MSVPPDTADLDGDEDTVEPIPFDRDLHARFVDDLSTSDCWQAPGTCGDPPVVDMGAYEAPTAGDCNWDERVDLVDFDVFSACLTGPGGDLIESCWMLDLDHDGDVDLADHGAFQCYFTGSAP
jgi:hypothetical protein